MIQFIEHKNINKKKWDSCISKSSHPSIFVYSWYLDIVFENWSALVLNDYEGVFPLAPKSKYKINYLFQPFFTRYFGVYTTLKLTNEFVSSFFDAIPDRFKFIEFCLHESNLFQSSQYELSHKKYQLLDLSEKYENLQNNFSDNVKRNIKKGIKSGLRIELDIDSEKIVNLFKINKGNELNVFDAKDYKILVQLMDTCKNLNKGKSIAVFDGDELCAAAFFTFSDKRFTFLKSGVTEIGKTKGAMHLLFSYVIRENAEKDYLLDFGGSSVESVARFYKSFGAKDYIYLQVKQNKLPRIVKWVKSLKK